MKKILGLCKSLQHFAESCRNFVPKNLIRNRVAIDRGGSPANFMDVFREGCWWNGNFFLLLGTLKPTLMEDITELFVHIIEQSPSLDIAESNLKQILVDEPQWRAKYKAFCREMGYSERRGFIDYYEEHYSPEESIWDNLKDYDDIE